MALLVRENSAAIWQRALCVWSRKDSVRDLLLSNEVVIQFEWNAVERIQDKRLRYLAARLMYEEWPGELPSAMKLSMDSELNRRLHAGLKAPWTTFATAQRDIEKMLPDADLKGRAILLEYLDYTSLLSSIPDAAE